jgi:hypothetical protein
MSSYVVGKETINAILTPLFYALDEANRANIMHDQIVQFASVSINLLHNKRTEYKVTPLVKSSVLKTAGIDSLIDFFNSDLFQHLYIDEIEFNETYPDGVNQFRYEKFTLIGRCLLLLNSQAYNTHYPSDTTGFTAGAYTFKKRYIKHVDSDQIRKQMYIDAIGACKCYLYQISEDEIDKSAPAHFIELLQSAYEKALIACMGIKIPWGIE